MENKSLERSLFLLTEPLTVAAMVLLFLNDHFLRVFFPSWVTGKLGDLAWLYFSPLALAVLLALIFRRTVRNYPRLPMLLAVSLIGGLFGAANAVPAAASWMANVLGIVLGRPAQIISDPTDLLTLAAVGLAYWRWCTCNPDTQPAHYQAIALLALSAVLTLSNSPPPDLGIVCLVSDQATIIANTNINSGYVSEDGGLTWKGAESEMIDDCIFHRMWDETIPVPGSDQLIIGFDDQNQLSESRDGGRTWEPVLETQQLTQAETIWKERNQPVGLLSGPFDAIGDPMSGHVIVAMGWEGVLVRKADGEWVQVPVGEYQPDPVIPFDITRLLSGEILLAAAYGLLLVLTPDVLGSKSLFQKIWIGTVWLAWVVTLFIFQPSLRTGFDNLLVWAGSGFIILSILILLIIYLIRSWDHLKSDLSAVIGKVLVGFSAVLAPFVLWGVNAIPDYTLASLFSLIFSAVLLAASYRYRFDAAEESPQ